MIRLVMNLCSILLSIILLGCGMITDQRLELSVRIEANVLSKILGWL